MGLSSRHLTCSPWKRIGQQIEIKKYPCRQRIRIPSKNQCRFQLLTAGSRTCYLRLHPMPGRVVSNTSHAALQYFDIETLLRDLPRGERWLKHLRDDLLPFWTMPSALGKPVGNFPTYRNNDGSLADPGNLKPEFQHLVDGIVWLDRDHVRAKSRQCFAYGVAYHMTGEEVYLDYAKAGVDFEAPQEASSFARRTTLRTLAGGM